jgi:energy-converting hydrogenase Eha subunit A
MNEAAPPPRRGHSRLALGIILLTLGAALLALNLGVRMPWELWRYFPVPLLALGLWGVVSPSRNLDRIGGMWLLANGLFCLIGIFGLFGLGWSSAWPIYIIAAGLSVILHQDRGVCGTRGAARKGDE